MEKNNAHDEVNERINLGNALYYAVRKTCCPVLLPSN
jgi:CRISPR/Cas system-associated endonuclease Cas1